MWKYVGISWKNSSRVRKLEDPPLSPNSGPPVRSRASSIINGESVETLRTRFGGFGGEQDLWNPEFFSKNSEVMEVIWIF